MNRCKRERHTLPLTEEDTVDETSQRDATCKACMVINECVMVFALEGILGVNGDYRHLERQTSR